MKTFFKNPIKIVPFLLVITFFVTSFFFEPKEIDYLRWIAVFAGFIYLNTQKTN